MVQPVAELGEGHEAKGWIFAGVNHVMGDEGGGFVGWDAAILLKPLLLVDALGAQATQEVFAGFVAAGFCVDALDNALTDGVMDGNGLKFKTHGVAVLENLTDELVEDAADSAV